MNEPDLKMPGGDFLKSFMAFTKERQDYSAVWVTLTAARDGETLKEVYAGLPQAVQDDPEVKRIYNTRLAILPKTPSGTGDPLQAWIKDLLVNWKESIGDIKATSPEDAADKVADISAKAIELMAAATAIDLVLGAIPTTQEGVVSSNRTRHLLTALGVGAVIAAVSHDPIKMGVLRPYQDSLEMTFRNRRPESRDLFQAYRTRELTPIEQTDLTKLDDAQMDRVEAANQEIYDREIGYWGYPKEFADALARSATITPRFADLNRIAMNGKLSRGFAIYSLWGAGYDRVVMREMLNALDITNEVSNYQGFRSMVEPSFVSGDIEESDLVEYWNRIHVPPDVQAWVLPRLRKSRQKAAAIKPATEKEKDLTVSQIQAAYVDGLISRDTARTSLLDLTPKYDPGEVETLLKLADHRIKTPSASKLKRLPLSDYEKAYKNRIITREEVLDRMAGEYDPRDIALESALLDAGKA